MLYGGTWISHGKHLRCTSPLWGSSVMLVVSGGLKAEKTLAVSDQEGGLSMNFVLIDLFGGTTDFFESEQEALQAADEVLDRYRQQATFNE